MDVLTEAAHGVVERQGGVAAEAKDVPHAMCLEHPDHGLRTVHPVVQSRLLLVCHLRSRIGSAADVAILIGLATEG